MKIQLDSHSPHWATNFLTLKEELSYALDFLQPTIEHIGSTSVIGLMAKPIIDILVGVRREHQLEQTIAPLIHQHYVYYKKYNQLMPYRRLFVKFHHQPAGWTIPAIYEEADTIPTELSQLTRAHIHILEYGSEHWTRHIAFRDYLIRYEPVRTAYQTLKQELSRMEWKDGLAYNDAKNAWIKQTEEIAVDWYKQQIR